MPPPLPRRALLAVFALTFSVYLLTAPGHLQTIDFAAEIEVARSIVHHGDFTVRMNQDVFFAPDGSTYSFHYLGESLLLVPIVVVSDLIPGGSEHQVDFVVGSFLDSLLTGLLAVFFCVFAVDVGFRRQNAFLLTILMSFASLAWPYAHASWDITAATLYTLVSTWAAFRFWRHASLWWLLLSGAGAGAVLLTRGPAALVMLPLGAYVLARRGSIELRLLRLGALAAPVLAGLAAQTWYDWVRLYSLKQSRVIPGAGPVIDLYRPLETVPALLVSPGKGLLVYCPVLFVSALGARRFLRRDPGLALLVLAQSALTLLGYSVVRTWYGGDSWGPRFLVTTVPLLLLPVAEVLGRWGRMRRALRTVVVALIAISALVQVLGVVVDFEVQLDFLNAAGFAKDYWNPSHSLVWRDLVAAVDVVRGSAPYPADLAGHSGITTWDFWWVYAWREGISRAAILVPVAALLAGVTWSTRQLWLLSGPAEPAPAVL